MGIKVIFFDGCFDSKYQNDYSLDTQLYLWRREGIKLVLLADRQSQICQNLGISTQFNVVYLFAQDDAVKKQRRIRKTLEEFELSPSESLVVDVSAYNCISHTHRLGVHTYQLTASERIQEKDFLAYVGGLVSAKECAASTVLFGQAREGYNRAFCAQVVKHVGFRRPEVM